MLAWQYHAAHSTTAPQRVCLSPPSLFLRTRSACGTTRHRSRRTCNCPASRTPRGSPLWSRFGSKPSNPRHPSCCSPRTSPCTARPSLPAMCSFYPSPAPAPAGAGAAAGGGTGAAVMIPWPLVSRGGMRPPTTQPFLQRPVPLSYSHDYSLSR